MKYYGLLLCISKSLHFSHYFDKLKSRQYQCNLTSCSLCETVSLFRIYSDFHYACCSLSAMQLHVTISKTSVKVMLDCSVVGEKSISASGNITTDGVEILGRMVRSRGRRDSSAPVSLNAYLLKKQNRILEQGNI